MKPCHRHPVFPKINNQEKFGQLQTKSEFDEIVTHLYSINLTP